MNGTMNAPAALAASSFVAANMEKEELINQQRASLEYLLQQQENVRKAQLLQQ